MLADVKKRVSITASSAASCAASSGRRAFLRSVASAGASALVAAGAGKPETSARPIVDLKTRDAVFTIDAMGSLVAMTAKGRNLLAPAQPAPVLSLRVDGRLHAPDHAVWNARTHQLTLSYAAAAATAVLAVRAQSSHIRLELTELETASRVELVLWGPYPVAIGDLVGEVVGVVRDEKFAAGIQALNAKTLGGYPGAESDIEPDGFEADDAGQYPGLDPELRKQQHWRGNTAQRTAFGSTLQAYCRNRNTARVISNWGHEKFVAPPFADGGVTGSRIALFACASPEALLKIGEIEVAEGLPHPVIGAQWAKLARAATESYLITDFGEGNIDQAIAMTKRAGLKHLYQSSPFDTWGHFRLKAAAFPNGVAGFRACVEKARQAGIGVGFHTLSNFITPNDAYVSPKPDPRLARIGTSELTADIDAAATEIAVADPVWFQKKTDMNGVVIGDELIRYDGVSGAPPWRLLQCERGAWGTKAASHRKGDAAGKLIDHAYKVFLTDAALSQEVARNIAAFCNQTGATQISLDGLEGNWSTGMGQYGRVLFTESWYNALDPALRGHVINDASNPAHFNWHIASRYNWGEPWYAGFRQSQTLYRLKNQLFYTRNLLPRMLGWFSVRAETTPEDAEWLCARAAGFDAGFALATSFDSKATQSAGEVGAMDARKAAIFDVIRQWETARQSGAFPEDLKPALQDVNREFHLREAGPGEWELQPSNPPGAAVRIRSRA